MNDGGFNTSSPGSPAAISRPAWSWSSGRQQGSKRSYPGEPAQRKERADRGKKRGPRSVDPCPVSTNESLRLPLSLGGDSPALLLDCRSSPRAVPPTGAAADER